MLAPAHEALGSPCLDGPITAYPWVEGIALMTVFSMFFIELLAARFEIFGQHEHNERELTPVSGYSDNGPVESDDKGSEYTFNAAHMYNLFKIVRR